MAEELNVDKDMSSMSMPDLSAFDTSSLKLPADFKSADAYKNVVGNPLTGSNPQFKLEALDTTSIADNFENKIRQAASTYDNPYKKMRPYSYNGDYDGANFERYHSTDQYKTLGFSPYRDNESLYNNNMTLGDQFVRAASQWDNLVATGFKSGLKSWGTLFTDPLAPDMESANEMKRAMAIGSSGAGGLGGFAINTFLNSGFTIGIAADFVAEELALSAATAFTGGLLGEATLPGMAAKAGLASRRLLGFGEAAGETMKAINKGAEIERLAKAGKEGNEALNTMRTGLNSVSEIQSFWNTMGGKAVKGTFDVLNPLENTIKALQKTDYASSLAKATRTFGGFADDIIQIKGTVSEAVLEGGMAKLDVTEKLIDNYRASHFGQDPEGEELTKIENLASQEAHRVALYNLPAIGVSNKLMYATMIAPISKLIGRGSSNSLNSILFKNPLKGGSADAPFEVLGQGLKGRATAAIKSLANPKVYGKFGMDYLKANVAEGVQENLQDAISSAAIEHSLATYTDPSKASYEGYMGYFMDGLNNQFSAQGAETFAGGLAMGLFAQPVMGSVSWTVSELADVVNRKEVGVYKANKEAQDQRDAAALNALYKDDLNFFAPDIKNSIKQQGLAKDFHTAVQNGDEKEARDAQFNAIQSHLSTAIRTGKLDIFLNKLAKYKELDPKSALEAFQKYGITTEEDAVKAQGQIDKVIERAENLRNKSENIGSEFPNPYNYQQYQAGTPLHSATVKAYEAWEEAKQNLLYAESAFEDHSDRVSKMANTFSSIANEIGKADAQTFMTLLDPNTTTIELATLQKEIETLDVTPEQAKLKKDKQKTFDLLSQYHSLVQASQLAETPEQKKDFNKASKKAFKAYVNHVSKKNNSIVFDAQVNKAYQLIVDSHTLKNEMQGLAKSINVLSNPQGFLNTQERIYTAFQELNKEKIVKDNQKTSGKIILNNKLHNGIFKKTGLKIPEDFMDAYKKAAEAGEEIPTPTAFVNPKTNELVTEGEDFDNALEIWKGFAEVLPKEESKTKKKEPVINEQGEEEYKSFSDNLKNDITTLFEQAKKDGNIAEDETIGNFIKTNESAILQIKVTQSQEKLENLQAQESEEPKKVASAKIETAPHPEAVEALNMMGYTNTQIKELTKDERTKILKEGILAEDFYKEKTVKPGTTPTDIEAKKADIERRRKEEVSLIIAQDKKKTGLDTTTREAADKIDKINANYDAELAALEEKPIEDIEDALKKEKFLQNNISKAYIKDGKEGNIYVEKNKDNTYTISGFKYRKDSEGNYIQAGFQSNSGEIINLGYERDMKSKISETVSSEEVVSTINKISQTISPDLEILENKPVEVVKEVSGSPVNDEYVGKIIYMTPGSGKEELAKNNIDVVDVDDLILQTAEDMNPNFKPDPSIEKFKEIGRAYDSIGKKALEDQVAKNMKELADKGKTLITSSKGLMKNADIIMIQQTPKFITKGYDIMSEMYELANLDTTTIAITDSASNVLQKPSAILLGQAVAEITEEVEPQDITVEYINKNINEKNLNSAKEKGFDAIYKNERFAIVKVNKKTVSLKPIEGNPISVNIADITAVVSSEEVPVSEGEIDIFNKNQGNVKKGDIILDETPTDIKDTLTDIINNLCNKK